MRRALLIAPAAVLVAALVWVLASGVDMRVAAWAAGWQRDFQTSLAGTLRALRAGEPGAVTLFLGICFAYGFFHAVGPGHGKLLIGGYGLGRRVALLRLAGIAVISSLGQAATAILLVLVGLLLVGFTRQQLTGAAETLMLPASTLAVAGIGLWLVIRGLISLWRLWKTSAPAGEALQECSHGHAHHHDHGHDHDHCGCGHRHAPTLDEVERAGGLRDMLMLVGGVAIRPCSGAILLLVLSAYMDLLPMGILGTLSMALGTATVTVAVAIASVFVRESTLRSFGGGTGALRLLPVVEIAAGAAICLVSLEVLARLI
ncbi:nickel/cobalt transporter [Pseudoroseicyclus aestuarii]|uniref:Nickel/cobalt efflux system n=1 Tax=Pseudoroseicyclus aestuarii TaxID=1795041 RepID=A0A318SPE1_9RHOB|nr:hypothetical protein [Pseudoroseicyclus aestuarii]PYE82465.1 ABC-type nickel/cobalt efflux system permease component RcnA [Pseudoroseicyclus aestuarii]